MADSQFDSQFLPHPNEAIATWYLLTASEDMQRMLFIFPADSLGKWKIDFYLDRYKFSLRHCLMAVRARTKDRTVTPLPYRAAPAFYQRSGDFLKAGIDYSTVTQICSAAHSGSLQVIDRAEGYALEFNEQLEDSRYGVLELMRQTAGAPVISFASALLFWIQNPKELPDVVCRIAEQIRASNGRIRYIYDLELAVQLAQYLHQAPFLIPENWVFPWGGRTETTLLQNALSLRIIYHLCAVHFGASRLRLKGVGNSDLCLRIAREQLVEDMAMLCSLERPLIDSFVDYLTYGRGVDSPDQALQPLVPLGKERFGIAGIGFLSSNIERNLLTLQARLEPKIFDSRSSAFEVEMTKQLGPLFAQKWQQVAANRTFQLGTVKEELDLLICEPETKTLLVLELRWMLSPADPREVQTKKTYLLSESRPACPQSDGRFR
ncbi:hypothetical protein [Silvimonas amylolytica]|uniref:hypothetical protein n=1 Tax=Silvimonas amylolytica TaxID=449663 RepID=UPI001E54FD0E|nr:hypothetical protein [Silvimonas amylolytica]